ncbi:MAG: MutS2 protein [candidate division NC10 bacterium CSP1-5]|nr:MAG: MutS2 protein [candidate division NC10 bacterium CSP1-5]
MDERSRSGLEFVGILDVLQEGAVTPLGKERAGCLGPLQDVKHVQEALAEAAEAQALLERGEEPPFARVADIRPHLIQARVEGASLDPRSLWQIYETLQAARLLRAFFHREREAAPLLWKRASGLVSPEALCTAIAEAITPEGEVSDAASPGLGRVRRELRALREAIVTRLERMLASPTYQPALAEPIITVRNDRYVIPVKASAKGRIRGIVQDQSGSGLTIFLEPTPVVEMNNRLRMLLRREEEEVTNVLRSLTGEVGRNAERIGAVLERVGDLDLLIAKGRLAVRLRAGIPRVTEEPRLILRQARHPFLVLSPAPEQVPDEDGTEAAGGAVPIDLEVGGAFAVVVISGPNTGGKTVALKTAGLLTLMTLSGLPIPASPDSQVPCYRAVFADIGDEQSIAESLSTFSSHMSQIVKILARAGPETLILLDEVGAGTDPSEGAALGIAILEALRQRGASVIATTHLEAVKAYAALTPGVEIASVEFDQERLTPRYSIRLGLPGQSYGLEIAGRLGLPGPILEQAREALPEGHHKAHSLIEALEVDRRHVDELRARLQEEVQRTSILTREAEELVVRLREAMSTLRHRAREEALQLLAEIRQQGEGLMRALREQGARPAEVRAFHQGLEALRGKVEATEAPSWSGPRVAAELRPGQWVSVAGHEQHGRVLTEVSGQGTVEVELKIGRVPLPVSALSVLSSPPPPRGEVPLFVEKTQSVSPEINLVGCTVEEATRRLDKYLDGAFVEGVRQVRVIHGKGTGILRKAVHTYLASHPLVEDFHLAEVNQGGSGATIAVLQDR